MSLLLFWTLAEDLQLMEIAEVERKDVTDHPESYTLLTTLDEGRLLSCSTLTYSSITFSSVLQKVFN